MLHHLLSFCVYITHHSPGVSFLLLLLSSFQGDDLTVRNGCWQHLGCMSPKQFKYLSIKQSYFDFNFQLLLVRGVSAENAQTLLQIGLYVILMGRVLASQSAVLVSDKYQGGCEQIGICCLCIDRRNFVSALS